MAAPTEAMAFALKETAHLAHLSEKQVREWTDLVRPSWGSGSYTFRDIVGLRTMRHLQEEHRVSTQGLRKASGYLRQHAQAPWSELKIGVGPHGRLYFFDRVSGTWSSADAAAQIIAHIALDNVAEALEKEVRNSRRRPEEQEGKFEKTRGVCGGQTRFAGTRIARDLVVEFLRRKATSRDILLEFPTLTRRDVAAAREHLRAEKLSAA